jgi:hypothetical protein
MILLAGYIPAKQIYYHIILFLIGHLKYILYLFPMKDWLMPWWIKNCYKYETVPDKIACNRTYNTISKPVPFKDIFTALKNDGIEKYCQHYVINVEDKFVDPNPDSF